MGGASLYDAEKAYRQAGSIGRSGLQQVAQARIANWKESDMTWTSDTEAAGNILREIGDKDALDELARTIVFTPYDDVRASVNYREVFHAEVPAALWIERGDALRKAKENESWFERAAVSYRRSGDTGKIRSLLDEVGLNLPHFSWKEAEELAIAVGDSDLVRRYAEGHFVHGYGDSLTPVQPTPELRLQRGMSRLKRQDYAEAFGSFDALGESDYRAETIESFVFGK